MQNGRIKSKNYSIFLTIFSALFLFARTSLATTYYVATTRSDTNPGTQAAPFQTIQKAGDVVNPGDTVLVGDGTYTDTNIANVVVYVQKGGISGNPVTFKSQNKWGAKVDLQTRGHGFFVVSQYIIIQDFEITGGADILGADGIFGDNGAFYLQVMGNHIHDISRICTDTAYGNCGIYIANGVNHVTFEKNLIHDIGRYAPGEHGCSPSNGYYQHNDHGIYLDGGMDYTIRNNIFYKCNRGWAIHLYPHPITNLSILNNTFAFPNPWRNGHIVIATSLSNSIIANNISYQATTGFINSESAGSLANVQVNNNLTYPGTTSANTPPSGITFSGNIDNTDPKLVNPTANDFHLQSNSPAINAGVSISSVTDDYDGVTRPQACCWDIGAYEYVSGGGDTTSPSPPRNLRTR